MILHRYLRMQVSIEFLFYVMTVLLAVTIYIYFVYTKYDIKDEIRDDKIYFFLKGLEEKIEYVYTQGEGYYINITFPREVGDYHYSIESKDTLIMFTVKELNTTYFINVPVNTINVTVLPGDKHYIKNVGGGIYVAPY